MSLEAWGDEGFDIPEGYMTVERCQEINAELQAERDELKQRLDKLSQALMGLAAGFMSESNHTLFVDAANTLVKP